MDKLMKELERRGGLASRRDLVWAGVSVDTLDIAVWYGKRVIRVRNGWFARTSEDSEVLRAWRVGGRLTCVSALAFHEGESHPVLHIEVPANTSRLHDPDDRRRLLTPDAAVVVHWTRYPGRGTLRSVSLEHAAAVAANCGVHAAGIRRAVRRQAAVAAESVSASRIV